MLLVRGGTGEVEWRSDSLGKMLYGRARGSAGARVGEGAGGRARESRAPALVRSRRRWKNQADVAKVLDAPWRAQRVLPVIMSRAGRLSRPVDERESSCATRIAHDLRSEDQVWRYVSTALIRALTCASPPYRVKCIAY